MYAECNKKTAETNLQCICWDVQNPHNICKACKKWKILSQENIDTNTIPPKEFAEHFLPSKDLIFLSTYNVTLDRMESHTKQYYYLPPGIILASQKVLNRSRHSAIYTESNPQISLDDHHPPGMRQVCEEPKTRYA